VNELDRVIAGIDAAADVFPGFKIDMVVIKGTNADEIVPMIEFAKSRGAELRFIEYMDVGGATRWSWDQVMTRADMVQLLSSHYGPVEPIREVSSAPADRYRLPDGTTFGIISSTTEPFCRDCDRSRLTADGMWYLCLYASRGTDLRGPLRAGQTADQICALIGNTWQARTDRGAEARLLMRDRSPMISVSSLKRDPHLEMHTRGG
jgi:cyclic pyranopterin phosphate synthase